MPVPSQRKGTSSSTRIRPKFLLDENVQYALLRFLRGRAIDAMVVPKSATDDKVASISKSEDRIVVTNDEDFIYYTEDNVYSVIWLRIGQSDTPTMLMSFDRLLQKIKQFSGKLFILHEKGWDEFPLGEEFLVKGAKVTVYQS